MRIAKVAFAFFSVGFLAGSFERAAGLGQIDRGQIERQQMVKADAAIIRSAANALPDFGAFTGGLSEELFTPPTSSERSVPDHVVAALTELLNERAAGRANPKLGGQLARSAIHSEPLTRIPPPLSVKPAGPLPEGPLLGRGKTDRETDQDFADAPEFIMPFERGRVTSLFHDRRYHPAIDLAGPLGTPVHATTRQQRVIFAGWQNGYGYTVVTRDAAGRMHLYGHLQRVLTKVGVVLEQGKTLGLLGSTGRSTGPHVHYEVKTRVGAHMNPATFLFPGRRVSRGLAWNGSRAFTRVASRTDRNQPRPR
jgi:murein DD-endopeptidase MepM/ murein hydrolase activator NlpD